MDDAHSVALEKGVGEVGPEEVALVVEEKKEDASNPGEVPEERRRHAGRRRQGYRMKML